jgi:hypothetical protein
MRKFLALFLVLALTTAANATIIDLVADQIWIGGVSSNKILNPTQTQLDNVGLADRVFIVVKLNDNGIPATWGQAPYTYDLNGYYLSILSTDIAVSGPGTLGVKTAGLAFHADLSLTTADPLAENAIKNIKGAGPLKNELLNTPEGVPGDGTPTILANFFVNVDAVGQRITVNLSNASTPPVSQYRDGGSGAWIDMVEGDYGDLYIGIPEPMTIALLGMGGLGLLLRRRRA